MPPKRTFSGTREGGTALLHTLESMTTATQKTAKLLDSRYKANYLLDYPDANDVEIDTSLKNNIAWLGGKLLGSTASGVLRNVDKAKQAVAKRVENKANEPTRVLERTKVKDDMEEGKDRIIKEAEDDLAKKGEQILKIVKRKPRTDEDRAKQQQQVSELEIKNLKKQKYIETKNALKTFQDNTAASISVKKAAKQKDTMVANFKQRKQNQKDKYEKDMRDWEAQPVQTRGAMPPIPPPGIFPIQPKELEEDHKEENQLKKITRHNVEKIDDSVKVKPSSTVMPTIEGSDIRRALAKSNNRRFKIGTNVIKYHRLNGIGKTATDFI